MKRKIINIMLLTLLLAFLVTACSPGDDSPVTVRFSILNDRARTISSGDASINIAKYTFTLTPNGRSTGGKTETFEKKASGTYDISDVTPGEYTVKVEGKTKDDVVISEATKTYFVERSTIKSVILEIELTTLTGKQNVNIIYKWDVKSYNSNMTLKLKIQKQGAASATEAQVSVNSAAGTATYSSELDAGSYIFNAQLCTSSGSVVLGHVDVIRVTNSTSTLTQTINIDSGDVTKLASSVKEKISSPIEGTVKIVKNSSGSNYTVSLEITKKPDGVEDKDISVNWYNEDMQFGGTTKNAAQSLDSVNFLSGYTRVTAVMWCSDIPGSMGAASTYVNNN